MNPTRITVARKHAQLGVTELAAALGVSRATIYRWENGDNPPPINHLETIAHLCHVSIDWLTS